MSPLDDDDPFAVPSGPTVWERWLRRLSTGNPFYVLSAALFLAGLRVSFLAETGDAHSLALMGGLASYTLLLAAAALTLVRFAGVWNDVRTILLLTVLLFLATSVTFDDRLMTDASGAKWYYLGGLMMAIGISEGVLHGIRLKLPWGYRGPFYGLLALFFLYPLAIAPFTDEPRSEALMWMLWGFSPMAGLIVLTLLPAARRGAAYVRDNGSPWPWPFYPWSLFVFLAFGVIGREFLLCRSMQPLAGGDRFNLIFGPHFLVPFGFAVLAVAFEAGLAARNRIVSRFAMAGPLALVAMAGIGRNGDSLYLDFLDLFTSRLGGTPLFLTILAAAGFYVYAAVRGERSAWDWLTATLGLLAVYGPSSATLAASNAPWWLPIFALATLQFVLSLRQISPYRGIVGSLGLALATALALLDSTTLTMRIFLSMNVFLASSLFLGAWFTDRNARVLRNISAMAVVVVSLATSFGAFGGTIAAIYPLFAAAAILGYGVALRHRLAFVTAGVALLAWLGANGWRGYRDLRDDVVGLDYLAAGLALFPVAMIVSLMKAGVLRGWLLKSWRLVIRITS